MLTGLNKSRYGVKGVDIFPRYYYGGSPDNILTLPIYIHLVYLVTDRVTFCSRFINVFILIQPVTRNVSGLLLIYSIVLTF